jgi:hypothetical protein
MKSSKLIAWLKNILSMKQKWTLKYLEFEWNDHLNVKVTWKDFVIVYATGYVAVND